MTEVVNLKYCTKYDSIFNVEIDIEGLTKNEVRDLTKHYEDHNSINISFEDYCDFKLNFKWGNKKFKIIFYEREDSFNIRQNTSNKFYFGKYEDEEF